MKPRRWRPYGVLLGAPIGMIGAAWLGGGAARAAGGEAVAVPPEVLGPTAALAGLLLGCSAFFSGSETALFSLQPIDRKALVDSGHHRVDALLRRPRATLATLLIGNELVNATLSSLTAGLALTLFPQHPWVNVVILTPVLLLLGEISPKVVALRHNRVFATLAAPLLTAFSFAVAPLRGLLSVVADLALRVTGGSTAQREQEVREEQLRHLIDRGRANGEIKPVEQEMLLKVFDFGDLTVNRLMTPRPDIVSASLSTPWPELLELLRRTGLSRLPVWQGRPDNITGVLVAKSLLPWLDPSAHPEGPPGAAQLKKLLNEPRFVPTTKRAEDLLREFRTERFHMAFVVDEHGNVVGLVTLDDLLAELVGELLDETDQEDPEVTSLGRGAFTVRAGMDVEDFEQRFGVVLPEGEYNTVGGFILHQLGELPEKGEEVIWGGLRFIVTDVEERRLLEVSVSPTTEAEAR